MSRHRAAYLTTQQLKERGWTPAMIRDLLGEHDGLRPNRMSRELAGVRLYLEDRVQRAEASERFVTAEAAARRRQDAAAKAAEARRRTYQEQAQRYIDMALPELEAHPRAADYTRQELWNYHLKSFYEAELRNCELLFGLPRAVRWQAKAAYYDRYRSAVRALYGWEDQS